MAVALASPYVVQAATFDCGAGDVQCLIDAINTANANGEANTITLAGGTYTLTAVDNFTAGPTGLPSITSVLTLRGAGPDATIIERGPASAPPFRLLQIAVQGTLTLKGLTLQGGRCPQDCGGGGLQNLGTLTLNRSVIRGNISDEFNGGPGGGLQNLGTATLTHCAVISNGNFNTFGGGIANDGTLTIDRCTLTNNQAPESSGGGIANRGTLLLTGSALTGNAAHAGGGIANGGILVVLNSTLAGGGSGLSNTGTATVLNSTIAEKQGSGLTNGPGTVVLLSTLLAGNAVDCSGPGPITSLGHNLIGDPTGCTITLQPTDLMGDPGLDTFTDDGTPGNGHFPLVASSQAIDAGNSSACPRTDQLGQRRIGRCDVGATRFLDGSDVR